MHNAPLSVLKGIGESRLAAFSKRNIHTLHDFLYLLPSAYRDFSKLRSVEALRHGEDAALFLRVSDAPKLAFARKGLTIVSARGEDASGGNIQLVWYNQVYKKTQIKKDQSCIFYGRVDALRGLKLVNSLQAEELPGIVPGYPIIAGVPQKLVRNAIEQALLLSDLKDDLSDAFRARYGLMGIQEALRAIHMPSDMEDVHRAKYRLSFEDMLYYLLALSMLRHERQERQGIRFCTQGIREAYIKGLPYAVTKAQARVLLEIEADMRSGAPMNRLIQGDVGAGKTVLAFFALYIAVQNGYQGALMAPTEILARQHYALLHEKYGDDVQLVHGAMRKKERDQAYARVESGEAKYIVGTHALLQLRFHHLGVVVADEQHRFGVRQRAQLMNKSDVRPDALIMSATPIPRTLAMLLFGDLSLSLLDELPPGRKPVRTRLVPAHKRLDMYGFIQKQAQEEGMQAYVVCPLIEQSDDMDVKSAAEVYEELKGLLPALHIALLHGRMAAAKKEETLESFRKGDIDILISTTVVEVGIDVKNASIMVIENADRFGLAQLHQLRGRVGRGATQAYCFLLCGNSGENARERMRIMTETNDGFLIAQRDLALRGPGEFLGTRQHGAEGFYPAHTAENMEALLHAQKAADALMGADRTPENASIFERAHALYIARMKEIANN